MNAAQPPANANIAAPGVLPGAPLENAADPPGVIDAPAITAANAAIPGIPAAAAFPAAYHSYAAAMPDAANAAIPGISAAAAFPAAYHQKKKSVCDFYYITYTYNNTSDIVILLWVGKLKQTSLYIHKLLMQNLYTKLAIADMFLSKPPSSLWDTKS